MGRWTARDASRVSRLRQLVEKHRPELMPLVESIGKRPLSRDDREELRQTVAHEIVEVFDVDPKQLDELEDIIDWLGNIGGIWDIN